MRIILFADEGSWSIDFTRDPDGIVLFITRGWEVQFIPEGETDVQVLPNYSKAPEAMIVSVARPGSYLLGESTHLKVKNYDNGTTVVNAKHWHAHCHTPTMLDLNDPTRPTVWDWITDRASRTG